MKNKWMTVTALVLSLGLFLGMGVLFNATLAAPPSVAEESAPALAVQDQTEVQADLQAPSLPVIDDFEALDWGEWYWDADAATVMTTTVITAPHLVIPSQITNTIFSLEFASGGWGGSTGHNLPAPQDWSGYDGLSFWLYGSNSGIDMKLTITDNGGEGFEATFTDDVSGWKLVSLPWESFTRASWQPPGAPDDGLTLTGVTAYGFFMIPGTSAHLYFDEVKLFETPDNVIDDFEALDWGEWYWDADAATVMTTTVITAPHLVIPGQITNTIFSLEFASDGWGGSTGHNLPAAQDWSGYDGLSFWLYGSNSGTDMKLTITDNGGEGFEATFTDDVSGWKLVSLPWESFTRASWQPPGAPDDGLTLTGVTAYGFFMIPGTSAHLYFDEVKLFETPDNVIDDFEALDWGEWYWDADWGNTVMTTTVVTAPHLVIPGQITNTIFSLEFASGGWGGSTGHNLPAPQDWSSYDGLSFWLYGSNSGIDMKLTITDNGGEGFEAIFTDDVSGWKLVSLPWESFTRASWQPPGAPDDGLTLTGVTAYGFFMIPGTNAHLYFDEVAVFTPQATFYVDQIANPPGQSLLVEFSQQEYSVVEGDTLTITAMLNVAATDPVTVTYAVTDVTATLTEDYTITHSIGQLYFAPGETEQTFVINTIDDTEKETSETIALTLSDPVNAELGRAEATVTIEDNEAICDGRTLMIDSFDNYSMTLPTNITDTYGNEIGFFTWSDGSPVEITTTQVITGDAMVRPGQSITNTLLKFDSDIGGWGGFTHNFENEACDTWLTQDWSTYEGFGFWMYGTGSGVEVGIELQENRPANATVPDDGGPEIWSYIFKDDVAGWRFVEISWDKFTRKEIGNGAPNDGLALEEVHGWAFISLASGGPQTHYFDNAQICGERVVEKDLEIGFSAKEYAVTEGETATLTVTLNMTTTETVTVGYAIQESGATPNRDYIPVNGTLTFESGETAQSFAVETMDNRKYDNDKRVVFVVTDPSTGTLGYQRRGILLIEDDESYNPALLEDFEYGVHHFDLTGGITATLTELADSDANALPGQGAYETVLSTTYQIPTGTVNFPGHMQRIFGGSENWADYDGFKFWFYGQNTGNDIQVELLDNRAPDPGPEGWELVWSDEFNGSVGTPPNPKYWTHEIGDGALNGITGWGNGEFQYYTDSTDNAAMDGAGNLVITARKTPTDTNLTCWYGTCDYTSARLISQHKIDFAYGRIEANVKVPAGQGLWPAFWMLGNDINQVGWPTSGEIDIMEYVGKDPNSVYGTLHGPGYSGGDGYGSGPFDLGEPVADDFHLFAIEWEPGVIRWYIDDTNFFTATKTALFDLKPNAEEWVYDHPFFLLMNLAVGGNFPGNPDETTPFPAEMVVDYVRVYQAPDTSERFATTFTDDFTGWKYMSFPFSSFSRVPESTSLQVSTQVPDDGLTLTEMWGYSIDLPAESSGTFYMDYISLYREWFFPLIFKN